MVIIKSDWLFVYITVSISEVVEFHCLAQKLSTSHTRPTMKLHEILSSEMVILCDSFSAEQDFVWRGD